MERTSKTFTLSRLLLCIIAFCGLLFGVIYITCGNSLEYDEISSSMVDPAGNDGGLVGTNEIRQSFSFEGNYIDGIGLFIGTFGRDNNSFFELSVKDGDSVLYNEKVSCVGLKNYEENMFKFAAPFLVIPGKTYAIEITSHDVPPEEAVSFYYGDSFSLARGKVELSSYEPMLLNGVPLEGRLCFSVYGRRQLPFKKYYWPFVLVFVAILALFVIYDYRRLRREGKGLISALMGTQKYLFLLKQLVVRDFKTKYKRSALGVLWSFINPLLTMLVQYLVFSTLFKSSVENYALYLLSGGLIFGFFNEAVSMGLSSILTNASLINKVYVPKYVFPISRVMSSFINVLFSLVPFFMLFIIKGMQFSIYMVLIPLILVLITVFCVGMSMLLSTSMVFFRDTGFLWGIISMLWMYLTPIFYPDTIIPEKWIGIYRLNPLYQFITFFRSITINHCAPSAYNLLLCFAEAFSVFVVGVLVFKKNQDRFVLYL